MLFRSWKYYDAYLQYHAHSKPNSYPSSDFALKRSQKNFPQETMAANENRFAPELNEKEVIELLGNATPWTTHSSLSTPMTLCKANPQKPPPPQANHAFKYQKNLLHTPAVAQSGEGGRGFNIVKCISV